MDNILFGPHQPRIPTAAERIRGIVRELLNELDLLEDVIDIGLDFNVGVGGKRLTAAQRQKLNLARALLKRPDFIILNSPLSALDHRSQDAIAENVLDGRSR